METIFVAKYINDTLIAYSEDEKMIFDYLKNFYQRPNHNGIKVVMTKEHNPGAIADLIINDSEYQLDYFWHDIVVTQWEKVVFDEYFHIYKDNMYDIMKVKVRKRLVMLHEDTDDENIMRYIKKTLNRDEYLSLLSFDKFMEKIGVDEIQNIINTSSLASYYYGLNKSYKRAINGDD